jgi:hypothetical protein
MKTALLHIFIFGLCVTVTACSDPGHLGGSGSSLVQGGTGGNSNSGNDASNQVTPDADAQVPLIVAPSVQSLAPCTSPYAPVLEAVPTGALLPIFANPSDGLAAGLGAADSTTPTDWSAVNLVTLPTDPSNIVVFAELSSTACPTAVEFIQKYTVVSSFAPAAGLTGSTAISKDDSRFVDWATHVQAISYGANVTAAWQTPDKALGPATDDTTDVVSLGEGGTIAVGFDATLVDGPGYDFAVFENGFADNYLELAFVEVSSDGTSYVRFDTASLDDAPVGAYGTLDTRQLEGFAGKYRVGFGTPFDLAWLKTRPEVVAGTVDLSHITSVRIVDIIGDGRTRDSLGHVVYDPYPTTGSAGFDLEAVGLLNVAP